VNSPVYLDITLCNPLKISRRFGETYRLHLQGRRISRTRNQGERRWQAELKSFTNLLAGLSLNSPFDTRDWFSLTDSGSVWLFNFRVML
jgi:hypothetical protein